MLKKLFALLAAALALPLAAEPIVLQKSLAIDAVDKTVKSVQIEIPALQVPAGKIAVLKFNARVEFPSYGGWGNMLQIIVNNKVLEGKTAKGDQRILFRDSVMKNSSPKNPAVPWFGKNRRNTALLIFYAPQSATELPPKVLNDRAAGFDYVIRIDDLLQSGKKNQLKLNYLLQKRQVRNRNLQLMIKDLVIDFIDKPEESSSKITLKNGEIVLNERLSIDSPISGVAEKTIDFPAVKVPAGKVAVLSFDARIVTPGLGGWNNYLQLHLNGSRLDGEDAFGEYRLLHRGFYIKTTLAKDRTHDYWRHPKGLRALLMFFAPESATELDKRILNNRQCAYNYEIVIDDLVNRLEIGADDRIESNTPNRLKLSYFLLRRNMGGKNAPLLIKNLRIKFIDKAQVEKMRPKSENNRTLRNNEKAVFTLKSNNSTIEAAASGALQLKSNGETVFMDSFFSYPSKPSMKFNALGKNDSANAANWQVKVIPGSNFLTITARTFDFEITRKITSCDNKFYIHDKIKNISAKNAGLAFFERFSGNDLQKKQVRLAGQSDIRGTVDLLGSSNPTVFLAGKKSAWGVVYNDTLSRAQLQMRSLNGCYEAGSIGCGAKPGDVIEREFVIYSINSKQYFDFINQVRRDWGMNNHTIEGGLGFSNRGPQPPKMSRFASIYPWFEFCYYGNNSDHDGALLSREEFLKRVQKQLKVLRSKRSDVIIFANIENNLVPFDCRKYDWGKQIRRRGVKEARNAPGIKYGLFLSKELTAKLDAATPLKDSIIRSADGRAMIDNMYPADPVINLMVQPEIGNYRFKQMIEQIDFLMDKVGVNGIYIDQFQPYIIGGFSEDRWDGRTVELAADGSIKRYRYSYALTGASARAAIIKHVTDKGGQVLTNGQSMSREEQPLKRLAFQEMENDSINPLLFMDEKPPEFRWQSVSHLGCPLALGLRPRRYIDVTKRPNRAAEVQTKGVITALRNGLLYYVYIYDINADGKSDSGSFDMFERMFPFTPVELNEGFVVGKERVITAVSRKFSVGGKQKPRCTHYNKRGIPKTADFAVSGKPDNWQVDVKINDWNEIAIIEVMN